jgi:hypothetical protein
VSDTRNVEQQTARLAGERARWIELRDIYARCIAIAELLWDERLIEAALKQQQLAETMRDRSLTVETQTERMVDPRYAVKGQPPTMTIPGASTVGREIPVPLFTPRDRLEFLGREAAKLLIYAERRNFTVTPSEQKGAESPPA